MVQMPLGGAVLSVRLLESLFVSPSMFGVGEKRRWVGNVANVVNIELGGKLLFWRNMEQQRSLWETICMASILLKSALLSPAPGRALSACSACIPLDNCLLHSLLICSTWGIYWNLLQVGYSLTVSPVFPLYIM
uniref:Uncharacterized protein n=1 Tax=Molossus molossus TaxID=27622 RepID=A0A7J8JVH1_MOLMO|nr:hypothetical protein HJG59_007931 [Molossus molossus]